MAGDNDYGDGSPSSIARDAASKIQQSYNKVTLPPEDPRGPVIGYSGPSQQPKPRGRIIGIGPDHYDLDK